jgi:hypothetical protein
MKKTCVAAGSLMLLGLSACAVYGSKAQFDESTKEPLLKRASFDMSCPAGSLTVSPVGQQSDGYDSVGVSGCEKKATYLYYGGKWILNSDARR